MKRTFGYKEILHNDTMQFRTMFMKVQTVHFPNYNFISALQILIHITCGL